MKNILLSAAMLFGMLLGVNAQVPQALEDGYKLVWHDGRKECLLHSGVLFIALFSSSNEH